jgi:hypothetical protein
MANNPRPALDEFTGEHGDSPGSGGDGDIPRILFADLGFRGAGWDVVDGRPVVVVDKSLSGKDLTRYLLLALNDVCSQFARFRQQGCVERPYIASA